MVWMRCFKELKINIQIVKTTRYLVELEVVLDFIAEDSLSRALEFAHKLNDKVLDLDNMPYKCRASLKSNDHHIRDLVFYGYVIPYRINTQKSQIEILGIFSENELEL